jgi:hypothetical protein
MYVKQCCVLNTFPRIKETNYDRYLEDISVCYDMNIVNI